MLANAQPALSPCCALGYSCATSLVTKPLLLDNPVRNYAWGSPTAIPAIQGRTPSGTPEAELWIGTHPAAPSYVTTSRGREELGALLERDANTWLGDSRRAFGESLPFLLKILAAAEPLSLQVHPNRARAAEVFAKDRSGPYVDRNHKPEVICALSPFVALHGFRDFDEAVALLANLEDLPGDLQLAMGGFTTTPSDTTLKNLLAQLVALSTSDAQSVAAAAAALCDSESRSKIKAKLPTATTKAVRLLLDHYPHDAMVVAPLLLNVVELQPGEALFTDAGTLHSYLSGTGVELMAASDNVLRAGLTGKKISPSELLRVTSMQPHPSTLVASRRPAGSQFSVFDTRAAEFELAVLRWEEDHSACEPAPQEIQILLCTSGEFVLDQPHRDEETPCSSATVLRSGGAVVIAAASGSYRLNGQGQLFRATVPQRP